MSTKLAWIKHAYPEHTGGGCMVDILTLPNNLALVVSDEYVGLYKDAEAFYNDEGEACLEGFWTSPHAPEAGYPCDHGEGVTVINPEQGTSRVEVEALAEDALNAACRLIQDRIGQTDGGLAGMFFSGDEVQAKLCAYIRAELQAKGV